MALVAAAACTVLGPLRAGLFTIAAATVLLLVAGIHNAWDNVTYLVLVKRKRMSKTT